MALRPGRNPLPASSPLSSRQVHYRDPPRLLCTLHRPDWSSHNRVDAFPQSHPALCTSTRKECPQSNTTCTRKKTKCDLSNIDSNCLEETSAAQPLALPHCSCQQVGCCARTKPGYCKSECHSYIQMIAVVIVDSVIIIVQAIIIIDILITMATHQSPALLPRPAASPTRQWRESGQAELSALSPKS